MKILVANLGSTSFKYRLLELPEGRQLARGGIDRIGQPASDRFVEIDGHRNDSSREVPDHATAVGVCLDQLTDSKTGCLTDISEVAAIGFKAVFAGSLSGVRFVDDALLERMEQLADIAPAHNPPYARAMRELKTAFPNIPLVAALETHFHRTIAEEYRTYAVPYDWKQHDVQRWGFHGASHGYIAQRIADVMGRNELRVISCHLGGSSSICAIRDGKSVTTSMGMSPQTGLPHNNRTGDFDPFALPVLMRATGKSLDELLHEMATEGGLLGISGLSGDLRDLEQAADAGDERAALAVNVYTTSIRHFVGSYMAALGGVDAIVFTGGIGENSQRIRKAVCENMEWAGLQFSDSRNADVSGEAIVSSDDSSVAAWVLPTNEELVVARQTAELLEKR